MKSMNWAALTTSLMLDSVSTASISPNRSELTDASDPINETIESVSYVVDIQVKWRCTSGIERPAKNRSTFIFVLILDELAGSLFDSLFKIKPRSACCSNDS